MNMQGKFIISFKQMHKEVSTFIKSTATGKIISSISSFLLKNSGRRKATPPRENSEEQNSMSTIQFYCEVRGTGGCFFQRLMERFFNVPPKDPCCVSSTLQIILNVAGIWCVETCRTKQIFVRSV